MRNTKPIVKIKSKVSLKFYFTVTISLIVSIATIVAVLTITELPIAVKTILSMLAGFFLFIGCYTVLSYKKEIITTTAITELSFLNKPIRTTNRLDITAFSCIKKGNSNFSHELNHHKWEELVLINPTKNILLHSSSYSNYEDLKRIITSSLIHTSEPALVWKKKVNYNYNIGFITFGLLAITASTYFSIKTTELKPLFITIPLFSTFIIVGLRGILKK